ncbi:DUF5677 domain-containing protein [Nostoc sp. MS1]|uniref:DUF5677 domain-containing protein n=1 Tax=Nostoc sp. MS1 TaxID=2764711 RepID=UPI001CC509ED|nr:DUF5677 domain-containing protein [Nostoc sp. MS1]BCL39680.1 hypothetical protein NSMS1_61270 [Nostoc sp. MS1]
MSVSLIPTTQKIEQACELLNEAISRLLLAVSLCPPIGRYEADVEASNLLKLIIRHVESIISISQSDLVLLPSAIVVARSAYETAIKLLWIIDPQDPFNREVRWLAHLQTEEEFYIKMSNKLGKFGLGQEEQELATAIKEFRLGVTDKLPDGYRALSRLPNLYDMLTSLNQENKYITYIVFSQFSHANHHATKFYRKNLGINREIGEYISSQDWWSCFAIAWYCIHSTGEKFLSIIGGDPTKFLSLEFGNQIQTAIDAIKDDELNFINKNK